MISRLARLSLRESCTLQPAPKKTAQPRGCAAFVTYLVSESLSALAQETRLSIYRLLVEGGPAGLSAGVIGDKLDVIPSSLSFHLAHLTRSGLVTKRRASRNLIYAADFKAMNNLKGYLTANCCGGEACAPVCIPKPPAKSRRPQRKSA